MNTEIWKAVPGYEGRYEVSDQGRVRSIDHRVRVVPRSGTEATRLSPGRMLKPGPSSELGHLTVAIGRGNSMPVHALVMLAFVGPRPKGMDVAHWDGDAGNNRLTNLRYATRTSNNQDMTRHGKHRLTEAQVRAVRAGARAYRGAGKDMAAAAFGVSRATISSILVGRHYGHVE